MDIEKIINIIVLAVIVLCFLILLFFRLGKLFRQLATAKSYKEAKEAVQDFVEDIKEIANDDKFENVRNFTVNLIINIIENGDNFNIREILGGVKEKCSKENVEYNEETWADFVTEIYNKRKGEKK